MGFTIDQVDAAKGFVMMSHRNDLPGVYGRRDFVGFDLAKCSDLAADIHAVIGNKQRGEVIAPGWIEVALDKILHRKPVSRRVLLKTPTTKNPASILRITLAETGGERWIYFFWNDPHITQQYSFATTDEELEQLVELLNELAGHYQADQGRSDCGGF